MSRHAVGRMIILPVGVAAAVGVPLRPLGTAAFLLGVAAFFAAQLTVLARSGRQLDASKRRLAASRARRQRLHRRP